MSGSSWRYCLRKVRTAEPRREWGDAVLPSQTIPPATQARVVHVFTNGFSGPSRNAHLSPCCLLYLYPKEPLSVHPGGSTNGR